MGAAGEHGPRQARTFRPQNIGGAQRMTEAGQRRGVVQQLHAHQRAAAGQRQLVDRGVAEERHVGRRVGGVGLAAGTCVPAGADGEAERGAEGVPGAQQRAHVGRLGDALGPNAEIAAG